MLSRETIYLDFAFMWAQRSQCKRQSVGAVITTYDMRQVISVGYNGPARGLPNDRCRDIAGACGCLHAEDNAICFSDPRVLSKRIFLTCAPCEMCAQRIIQNNIDHVYYMGEYRNRTGLEVLLSCQNEISVWKATHKVVKDSNHQWERLLR